MSNLPESYEELLRWKRACRALEGYSDPRCSSAEQQAEIIYLVDAALDSSIGKLNKGKDQ